MVSEQGSLCFINRDSCLSPLTMDQHPSTIPSLFTDPPSSPSRARSFSLADLHTPSDDPPLLDGDPFANLTSHPFDHPSLSQVPRQTPVVVCPQVVVPQPSVTRPRSSGHGQARPACTKPACAPRPSLPSLHTLAQMDISFPGRKVPPPVPMTSRRGLTRTMNRSGKGRLAHVCPTSLGIWI